MSKKEDLTSIIIIIILLSIILFSPQITDYFKEMTAITGRVQLQTYGVNVTVGNQAPKIPPANISVPANADVTAGGAKLVNFTFVACDQDEQNDNLVARGNYTGESDFFDENLSCFRMAWTNTTCQQFNCSMNIWSWYTPGSWNFSMNVTDGTAWAHSNSSTWTLGTTTAMVIGPRNISWTSLNLDSWNNTPTNDPITVNNTGNYNVTYGNVNITGSDLKGEETKTQYIPGANFTVNIDTSSGWKAECFNSTDNGTAIVNETSVKIGGSMLRRGNYSLHDGASGQAQIYFCLRHVPPSSLISTQSYSTSAYTTPKQWLIGVQS